jgi:hypothetical protein
MFGPVGAFLLPVHREVNLMLDEILEIFERDKKKSTHHKGGLRGRLATMLGGETSDAGRYASPYDDRRRHERGWDDDRDDTTPDSDDDRYDDRRYSSRRKKRDFDPFDFGD